MKHAVAATLAAAFALAPWPAPAATTTLGAAREVEHLDTGGDWTRTVVSLERRGGKHRSLLLEWRSVDRFEVRDDEFAFGAHAPLTEDIGLAVEFTGAGDPAIVPEFATRLDLDIKLPYGLVGHVIGRRASYPEDTATGFGGGLEYYFGAWRLAYEVITTSLKEGDSGTAHVAHADWYYGEENRVGLAGAFGDEATRLAPDAVIVADVLSAALAGRHWFDPRWGLAWAATWTEQGDFHTRTGGTLGILFRF